MNNNNQTNNNPPAGVYISKNKLILGILVIAGAVAAGAYFLKPNKDTNAQVIAVNPLYKEVKTPYQKCGQVATTYTTKNQKNGETGTLIGSGIGGAAGGAAGAAIGSNNGGNGKAALGGALGGGGGAVAGGLIGRAIDKHGQPDTITHTGYKTQCRTLYKTSQQIAGYKTDYLYNGQTASLVTQNPVPIGTKLPLDQLLQLAVNQNNQ